MNRLRQAIPVNLRLEGRHPCRPKSRAAATGMSPLHCALTQSWKLLILVLLGLSQTSRALACSACFGQTDDKMAQGMNAGIYALLIVIGGMLVAALAFAVFLIRRAATHPLLPAPAKTES